jgi:branched-chain amino acid transport system permease protein
MSISTINFAPRNAARIIIWGFTAVLFIILPLIFSQGFALTLLSQMGILVIFALSYNCF